MNYPVCLIRDNWKILAELHISGGEVGSSLMSISFRAFIFFVDFILEVQPSQRLKELVQQV